MNSEEYFKENDFNVKKITLFGDIYEADKKFYIKKQQSSKKRIDIKKAELQKKIDDLKLQEDNINEEIKKIKAEQIENRTSIFLGEQ